MDVAAEPGVLCGILSILHTGIQWVYLPKELGFGSGMTCRRRLRGWNEVGVWRRRHEVLLAASRRWRYPNLALPASS